MRLRVNIISINNILIDLLTVLIIFYFLLSNIVDNYIPYGRNIIQLVLLCISIFVVLKDINIVVKTKIGYIIYAFIIVAVLAALFTSNNLFNLSKFMNSFMSLSYLFFPILAYPCTKSKNIFNFLLFFGIINSIAIILERFWGIRFVMPPEDHENYTYSIIYKLGLFSNPKQGGFFLLFTGYIAYLKNNPLCFFFFMITTIFSGVRTGTIGLLIVALFFIKKFSISTKLLFGIFILPLFVYLIQLMISRNYIDIGLIRRLLLALSVDYSGNHDRLYYYFTYLSMYMSYSFINLLFGNIDYIRFIVGNGSESAMIQILVNTGIIGFIVFLFPLIHEFFVSIKKDIRYSVIMFSILFVMCIGRVTLAYSDGIILWIIILDDMIRKYRKKQSNIFTKGKLYNCEN
jgi:hypothetical protein